MATAPDSDSVTKAEGADASEVSEFDAAWDELETASEAEPPTDTAAGDQDKDPEEPDAGASQPGSDEEAGKSKEAAVQQDPPASQASDDDPLAGLDEAARERVKALLDSKDHTIRSVTGRLSAADRQLAQLRQGGQQREPNDGPGGQNERPKGQTAKALLESDDVKRFREEYGDDFKPILGIIETLAERLDGMSGTVEGVEEQRTQAFLQEQVNLYAADHPDWQNFATDDRFSPWLATQPRHIREAAARNSGFIVDASEASDVLTRFKAAHGIKAAAAEEREEERTEPSHDESTRRERQKQGAGASKINGPSTASGVPDDFDGAWDAYEAEDARRNRQRR